MSELSPEARRLLALEDDADATAADEARVRARLEVDLGVVLPAAALAASATVQALATGAAVSKASLASAGATAATMTGAAAATAGTTSVLTLIVAGVVAVAAGAGLTTAAFRVATPAADVLTPSASGPQPHVTPPPPVIEVASDVVVQPLVEPEPAALAPSGGAGEPSAPELLAPDSAEPVSETTALPDVARPAPHAPKPVDRVASGPVTPGVAPAAGSEAALADGLPPPPLLASERQEPALPVPEHCDRLVELKHINAAETALFGAEPAAALIDWYESEHPAGDELLQRARIWCPDSVFVRHDATRETESAE